MAKRLTVFAGFDKDEIIDDYVIYYLKALKKVSDIIFVYDNKFPKSELAKIKNLVIHSICERHGGYDFGSYKIGYLWAKSQKILKNYDSLTFCNDSVYGPVYDLKPYFEKMESDIQTDFWGMFIEAKHNYNVFNKRHVQSYFMSFKRNVFMSELFDNFVSNIENQKDKGKIITKYEVGFSDYLIKNGFKENSILENKINLPHTKKFLNILDEGYPFVKRSIFSHPLSVVSNNEFEDLKVKLAELRYPFSLIENHLNRLFGDKGVEHIIYCDRKFSPFYFYLIHPAIMKITGIYLKDDRYKLRVKILKIPLSIKIPRCISIKKIK